MKFNPKTEQAIREEMLLPPGDYDFEVLSAEAKTSRSGNPMTALKLAVFRANGSRQYVSDWLLEKVAYKLRHFCYAVGLGPAYEAGDLNAADCVGKVGRVSLKVEEQDGYEAKNAVKDYVVVGTETVKPAANAAPKLPAQAANADEPPF